MTREEKAKQYMESAGLCPNIISDIELYIERGIIYDGFPYALLISDLKLCCEYADDFNKKLLYEYTFYLYNYVGMDSWGSVEKVKKYSEKRKKHIDDLRKMEDARLYF